METTKYYIGAQFEWKLMRRLRRKGYYCIRSAASHGPADIIAIRDDVRIIQCKAGNITSAKLERLKKEVKKTFSVFEHIALPLGTSLELAFPMKEKICINLLGWVLRKKDGQNGIHWL